MCLGLTPRESSLNGLKSGPSLTGLYTRTKGLKRAARAPNQRSRCQDDRTLNEGGPRPAAPGSRHGCHL